jgi:hypothetical protein
MSELDRLRAASLSPYDIKVLTTMIETGGEAPIYVDRLKPETRQAQIDGLNSMIARDLVEVDVTRSMGHRWMLRLTDHGRHVCAELEKMNAKKPVEVTMQGDAPVLLASPPRGGDAA